MAGRVDDHALATGPAGDTQIIFIQRTIEQTPKWPIVLFAGYPAKGGIAHILGLWHLHDGPEWRTIVLDHVLHHDPEAKANIVC